MCVMMRMNLCPIFKGNGTEKTTQPSHDIVQFSGPEEGLMTTIVLDDKNPNQKKYIDQSDRNSQPDGPVQTEVH
jgi:hypothetical protein